MASDSRFYQLDLRHRPALWGDVGSLLKIEGLVVGGEGAQAVFMLPDNKMESYATYHRPTVEEWTDWLQRSDNPEILVQGSLEKVFHRKVRYDISGAVQQKVWVADGCKCVYCNRPMGAVQLTIDHFTPLEQCGKNDTSNYLSACRKCNKDKGGMLPRDWCKLKGLDYEFFANYLENRRLP
jgi:5-methylcytosine-specific restriction endonuclease McrA